MKPSNNFAKTTLTNIQKEFVYLKNKKSKLTKLIKKVTKFHKDINYAVKNVVGSGLVIDLFDIDYYSYVYGWDDYRTFDYFEIPENCKDTIVILEPQEKCDSKGNCNLQPEFVASKKTYEEIVQELVKPLIKKHFKKSDHVRVAYSWAGC